MKKIFLLLFLIPLFGAAQDENTKVTVTIQARDCEFLGTFVSFNADYEDLFDGLKVKFRVASPPSNLTNVTIDTIPIGQWLKVSKQLRTIPQGIINGSLTRIETALRAVGNSFLTAQLDDIDALDTNTFIALRLFGRQRLRKL